MKLGLFGGSFDPVHEGHVLMAHAALEELSLDRLCFIPAAQSPLKPDAPPASGPVRTAMLRTALAGEPRFSIDDQELVRGGISYTIDTVRAFLAASPGVELFYMIGADHVPVLPKWREADQLAKLVEFIVVPRPGEEPQPF
ncbi:MAG TPA: nicotinate (nicotinamide) nucleotide adenylyltransferase, partial [Roseimicrobium sp.]|nr:nicotinate (nicotinamide) nucleotide adenylyltransferase [Roseimicrobium sp.]